MTARSPPPTRPPPSRAKRPPASGAPPPPPQSICPTAKRIPPMTPLAANKPRAYEGGRDVLEESALPVIASDIIYEGAAVGIVDASGHGRPLAGGDRFAGFANAKADNSAGAAAAGHVDVRTTGKGQ